jgi:GAF domain-containing protein
MTQPSMSRPRALACALVDLAEIPDTPDPVDEVLQRLVAHCAQLFGVAASVLLVCDDGVRNPVASNEGSWYADRAQQQHQQGPSLDCVRSATPIDLPNLDRCKDRWPDYLRKVEHQGFRAVHAMPLRGQTPLGALTLYDAEPGRLDTEKRAVAQALATAAATSIGHHRNQQQADLRIEQLQHALASRVVIEQAKGVLVGRDGMTLNQAFRTLRGHASGHRQSLQQLASEIVHQANHTTEARTVP